MPLYAGELNIRRGAPLAEYPAPLSEVLRAQAQETQLHNPLQSLRRLNALNAADLGDEIEPGDPFTGTLPVRADVRRVDAATARARVQEEGLKLTIPDDGISERALDILMKAKRDEMRRQDVFSRGPQTVGAGAARLGVALIESLFDPLNIASAFIPIVGPARYAALVARAGSPLARAGVRAQVGALEGAAGAALLEPLIYSAAQAEQLDYTMYDSLANIAFGGLFGGGLHTVGGAVRDVVQPGWWRMAERGTAPTPIQADSPILRAAEAAPAVREPVRSPNARDALEIAQRIADAESKPGFQRTAEDLIALRLERTPEIDRAVEALKQPGFQRGAEDMMFLKALEKGHEADYINDRIGATLRQMEEADRAILARGNSPNTPEAVAAKQALTQALERDVARLTQLGRTISEARLVMERVSPETRQAALKAAVVQSVDGRAVNVDAIVRADLGAGVEATPGQIADGLRSASAKNAGSVRSADPEASRAADVQAQPRAHDVASAEEELAESLAVTQEFAAALGISDRVGRELAQFDEAIKRAEAYAKALKAGAACGIG